MALKLWLQAYKLAHGSVLELWTELISFENMVQLIYQPSK